MKRPARFFRLSRLCAALLLAATVLLPAAAWAQAGKRAPHIGYLYPAGGRRGETVRVMAGGQFLRGLSGAVLSGGGVRARVVRYNGPVRKLNGDQRRELARRLLALFEKRGIELPPWARGFALAARRRALSKTPKKKAEKKQGKTPKKDDRAKGKERPKAPPKGGSNKKETPAAGTVKLPNIPLLNDLENLTPGELLFVANEFLRFDKKKQPNVQIAETAVIEVAIDPGASPGDRELRLQTPLGLSNPLCFQVGSLPEVLEEAPYDIAPHPSGPVDLPVVLNGQIRPGDVDRFRFRAEEGERLLILARARHLVPYLADAVPGWFQAVLTLYDPRGKEVAFDDDFRFDPDPVIFYTVPAAGVYEVEIRDAIYRGREDFVYRIVAGEEPFVTSLFPLGGREGRKTAAAAAGWNLPGKSLSLDTAPGGGPIRRTAVETEDGRISNEVAFAVDTLPERFETEPNDRPGKAQRIVPPCIVNGRIERAGDKDVFRFKGRAGREVVAEILARVLDSPMDSLLRLIDDRGEVVAWNDDHEDTVGYLHRNAGLVTHHADSYLRARLKRNGEYLVEVSDAQAHGGGAYAYRLRVGPPRPDFAILVTPPSVNVRAGGAAPLDVHALRRDGFAGEIEVRLKGAPRGFILQGGRIPPGCDRVRMTLTAPPRPVLRPVVLEMEGVASIDGTKVSRRAVPAENMMQAFLYRHLVPRRELMAAVLGGARFPPLAVAGDMPVRIPAGGTAKVRIEAPGRGRGRRKPRSTPAGIHFELFDPPKGVILENADTGPSGLTLVLRADTKEAKAGLEGNLIVEAFAERAGRARSPKGQKRKQRVSLGVLPAIPFEIVKR